MRFQILSALTAVLSASTAAAVLEPSTIVMAINKITDLSSDTIDIAQDIQNPFTAIPNGIVSSSPPCSHHMKRDRGY